MKLNRKQRRIFYNNSEEGKRIKKLGFLHPDRISARKSSIEEGKILHEENVNASQERIVERLSSKESLLTDTLKLKNLDKSKVDAYLEVWSDVNFWPKSKTYYESKKTLKRLNKEYNLNG